MENLQQLFLIASILTGVFIIYKSHVQSIELRQSALDHVAEIQVHKGLSVNEKDKLILSWVKTVAEINIMNVSLNNILLGLFIALQIMLLASLA